MKHPFWKFWEEISNATDIKFSTATITKKTFDLDYCRCAMTGRKLADGEPCLVLVYIWKSDEVEGKYEKKAMFLSTSDPAAEEDFPPLETIAFASYVLLNIEDYAKERWIKKWVDKFGHVARTKGIGDCMKEFTSGEQGLIAIKKWYHEYKMLGTLIDRFVS